MGLTGVQRMSHRFLGERARHQRSLADLAHDLRRARIPMRAEAYLASTWTKSALGAGFGLLLGLGVAAALQVRTGPMPVLYAVAPLVAAMSWLLTYLLVQSAPKTLAKKRARDIDRRLPYAVHYMATMTSAGVVPQDVFGSLARQDIYGEVAKEAATLHADMALHGKDVLQALHRAVERSPSIRFRDLLQGIISTVTSGGDLTRYLRQKADRFQFEHRVDQRSLIETMGIMAEAYVTVAVAGPLFLLVIMVIMVLMGSGQVFQLALVIYFLLPVLSGGFAFLLKSMVPEA